MIDRLGLDMSGLTIVNPGQSSRFEAYVEEYFRMRQRRGVMRHAAERKLHLQRAA